MPTGLQPSAQAWWRAVWWSSMAAIYHDADVYPLTRLARLLSAHAAGDADYSAEIRHLEVRFGLAPAAAVGNHDVGCSGEANESGCSFLAGDGVISSAAAKARVKGYVEGSPSVERARGGAVAAGLPPAWRLAPQSRRRR